MRPRDVVGKTRRRLAGEQLTELVAVENKIRALTKELKAMGIARGSTLMDLPGAGPVVAARILADVGDVARFADRDRFASCLLGCTRDSRCLICSPEEASFASTRLPQRR